VAGGVDVRAGFVDCDRGVSVGVDVLPWRFEPGEREEKETRVEIEISRTES
jgi:hypothetical protein